MFPPRPLARWLGAAALLAACGSGAGPAKAPGDGGRDAVDARPTADGAHDAAMEVRPARCCVVPTFASYSPYAGCNLLNLVPDATVDLVQACWDGDAGAGFGRWQCGGPMGQDAWCSSGGLSCAIGDLCWVASEDSSAGGCPGSVQPCAYPWR